MLDLPALPALGNYLNDMKRTRTSLRVGVPIFFFSGRGGGGGRASWGDSRNLGRYNKLRCEPINLNLAWRSKNKYCFRGWISYIIKGIINHYFVGVWGSQVIRTRLQPLRAKPESKTVKPTSCLAVYPVFLRSMPHASFCSFNHVSAVSY